MVNAGRLVILIRKIWFFDQDCICEVGSHIFEVNVGILFKTIIGQMNFKVESVMKYSIVHQNENCLKSPSSVQYTVQTQQSYL